MKSLFMLFTLLLSFNGRITDDIVDRVGLMIRNMESGQLGEMLDQSVKLTILGEENVYLKGQAQVIIDKFLKSHQPTSVKVIHRVDSNPAFRYAVYDVKTLNGNFRISLQMRNSNGNYLISELNAEQARF